VLCRAVQDASTASLVWVLTLMAEHPDVLERVRAEQAAARPDLNETITGETLAQMPYTRQVGYGCAADGVCLFLVPRGDSLLCLQRSHTVDVVKPMLRLPPAL
jgi:cytochrome P450